MKVHVGQKLIFFQLYLLQIFVVHNLRLGVFCDKMMRAWLSSSSTWTWNSSMKSTKLIFNMSFTKLSFVSWGPIWVKIGKSPSA